MTKYLGVNGQSLFDVCLNTYGTLDDLYKLLLDSSVYSIDAPVVTKQNFNWDPTLITDQNIYNITTLSGTVFATAAGQNGNTLAVIIGENQLLPTDNSYTPPNSQQQKYEMINLITYTAPEDGINIIDLTTIIGTNIVSITMEIKPLFIADWSWDKIIGRLTLNNGLSLAAGQSLFILYTKVVII